MNPKSNTHDAEKDRTEAISRFRDLFDTANVAVERISDILYLYNDTEEDYFNKDAREERQADAILVDYPRYTSYIKTANYALFVVLNELEQAIEKARNYYSEL